MKYWIALGSFLCLLLTISSCTETAETSTPTPENVILKLVNESRTTGCNCGNTAYPAVSAVTWNDVLEETAQAHSKDMENEGRMSHSGSDGSGPGDRITQAGYTWRTYGENVAEGYSSAESVVQAWLNSEGHCKNMMNGNFEEMGVAASGSYWTQVLATSR